MFIISSTDLHHFRCPNERVIKTSWGVMRDRHAVFICITDNAGRTGVGESWVNFPTWSPATRRAAFDEAYFPYLRGKQVANVKDFMASMTRAFLGVAVQAGCVGSLIAELCAIELALYDLEAQSKKLPLHKLWFPNSTATEVEIYASGINSPLPMSDIDDMLAAGVRLFKLKLGFGDEDLPNIRTLTTYLSKHNAALAVDTNRHWVIDEAIKWLPVLREHNVRWLEEPLKPAEEIHYPRLHEAARKIGVPLSAGENVWTHAAQSPDVLATFPVDILQPDITKNFAPSAAVELVPLAAKNGKRIVPHLLGSALGQAASLHLAAGCPDQLCEWDINPNPLRTDLLGSDFRIKNGRLQLPASAGLGWPFNPDRPEFTI